MTATKLDRNITLTHDCMKPCFRNGDGNKVSDLFVFKHYQAAILRIEQLERQLGDAADIDQLIDERADDLDEIANSYQWAGYE